MAEYRGAASEAGRAMQLKKKRVQEQEEVEHRRRRIEEDLKIDNMNNKFAAHYDAVEQDLKESTVGLVTLDQMKAKQKDVIMEHERKIAQKAEEKEKQRQKEIDSKNEKKRKQKQMISNLSFDPDDGEEEEEEEEVFVKKKKMGKNPNVDTSFLPDRDREEEENKLREKLREEWVSKQDRIKGEEIEISFSYWDGSGHRRTIQMKKGDSIYNLLCRCVDMLRPEFTELRMVTADQLMYVKEDVIIPHHMTFYDFIVSKVRGKSGPLFNFDVHDDVRLTCDATIEKEESHAGKVLLRSWYERNKHIFPASRWDPYDPNKHYSNYSIK